MQSTTQKVTFPYITTSPLIAQGAPCIKGTRTTVRSIARYYQMGMNVDEILNTLTHLTASQVHSALAYYFDHQVEIDQDWLESSDVSYWQKKVLAHPKRNSSDL